ncbi:MAG: ATP-dependent metallopeptidase FtsH/Yme1/Tma family protein, partial [Nocardioidaceae bacterium]
MKRWFRGPWMWVVLFAIALLLVLQVVASNNDFQEVDTAELINDIQSGQVKEITFIDGDQQMEATLENGDRVSAQWLTDQQTDILTLVERQVLKGQLENSYDVEVPTPSLFWGIISTFLPIILIVLLFFFLMNSMQGGGGRVMQFAKSKAKVVSKDTPKTSFSDVAGCDEAIEELGEIKEFLQQPAKFQAVGAKIPKGV